MLKQKEIVAMLLAGGQGSRLGDLTSRVAKPAVLFGGKYRIIDFPLSNCINSGIDTVGVLTQYQPLVLNEYIGNGQPWGLNRNNGGVQILQPYEKKREGVRQYTATGNAVYQNFHFIERYKPKYVIVLSGDHIYKMDYSKMLEFHKKNNASCTIAVINVPQDEASRFGILNTREDHVIYEFEEKPKKPKSTKASMGIYIFNWDKMKYYLELDNSNTKSKHDFGMNILPLMLHEGEKMLAYEFKGYWRDVGTVESLWSANMDLLQPEIPMSLDSRNFRIYSRNYESPPTYTKKGCSIRNSLISKGCYIAGTVANSVISSNVTIEESAEVKDSFVMEGAVIKAGALVEYAILGNKAMIDKNAVIRGKSQEIAVVSEKEEEG